MWPGLAALYYFFYFLLGERAELGGFLECDGVEMQHHSQTPIGIWTGNCRIT